MALFNFLIIICLRKKLALTVISYLPKKFAICNFSKFDNLSSD